jgi:hypothetical protein
MCLLKPFCKRHHECNTNVINARKCYVYLNSSAFYPLTLRNGREISDECTDKDIFYMECSLACPLYLTMCLTSGVREF